MSDTHVVDRNRVLRVKDSESYATAQYTSGGIVDRDKTDYLEVTGNADNTDPGITISAKNDNATDVDIVIEAKGSGTVTITGAGGVSITPTGSGAVNGGTVSASESSPTVHTTTLTLTATPLTITDESSVGQYGGVKIYDFPEGLICVLGAVVSGSFTAAAPIVDAWNGDFALGSAAPTGASLQTTASTWMQSTATGTASSKVATAAGVSAATQLTESGARWSDGTGTAKDLYLNLIIDDNAAHTGAMSATFTGTVTITWINLGDK